jgi:hypothetical protein
MAGFGDGAAQIDVLPYVDREFDVDGYRQLAEA